MSRKKILWLCSWYPSKEEPFNGDFIQRHARAAALYNDIYVIHVTNDFVGKMEKPAQEIKAEGSLVEQIVYFKRTRSLISKLTNQLKWLALYKKTIRNYIIKNGKPDLVHVHVPMKAGILGLWVKKNYKIPFLLTEHFGIYNSIIENGYSSKSVAFKQLTKRIVNHTAGFITVSNYLAKGVNELVCKKEYTVISNTVNTSLFFYKKNEGDCFRFVHVSNMVSLKNPEGILRAFKAFLDNGGKAELRMIGDANKQLKKYANDLGLPSDCFSFVGEIPYEIVAVEMQNANCLIHFSNIENSPCVIGEALCTGLPVITSDVGGIPELVNESNAIMIAAQNEVALKEAMESMSKQNTLYDRKKIAEIAKDKFSYPVIGKEIDAAYLKIVGKNSN